MKMPVISVVMPMYNSAQYIEQTIRSIQAQTFDDWELLIVDDCSTDGSAEIIENFAATDKRIRLIRLKENVGAAVARNTALDAVTGRYVAFLDADDEWRPEKLEKQLDFMLKNNYQFSFTAYEIITPSGKSTHKLIDHVPALSVGYKDMLKKRATMGCSTVMLDAKLAKRFRIPLIRKGQDYAFWLKILRHDNVAHCLPEPLTRYRIVPGSLSRNKIIKAAHQWHIYRQIEQIPFHTALYYFIHYAYRAVTR